MRIFSRQPVCHEIGSLRHSKNQLISKRLPFVVVPDSRHLLKGGMFSANLMVDLTIERAPSFWSFDGAHE
ncbi:MAG: hypothetical protein CMI32_02055 [Opitutales bacterium]|nr:hypothetical protein [Opitutales bacterium]